MSRAANEHMHAYMQTTGCKLQDKIVILRIRSSLFLALLICGSSSLLRGQENFTNSIGMEFVKVEPGSMIVGAFRPPYPVPEDTVKGADRPYTMWMGDGRPYNTEEFELAREMATRDVLDGFQVSLEKPYYLGKFEVTQEQWTKVMGKNPSTFRGNSGSDSLPVESVSWADAQKFIRKLNKLEKTKRYRLPTEFEWEYASRAGATNDIPWDQIQASANLSKKMTAVIGSKQPNGWGFFDMLGNVWEWVEDYYNEKIFADPVPPTKGRQHVLKGASFTGDVKNATYMTHAGGPGNGWDVGFRVLMEVSIAGDTSGSSNNKREQR
jgi:formylglycine-generating enzyme required for sulfatase activity